MSYVRWGSACGSLGVPNDCTEGNECPGSDIYLFDHCSGGIECCGCALEPDSTDLDKDGLKCGSWNSAAEAATDDPDDERTKVVVLSHLQAHRSAGHHVPEKVFRAFRGEPDPRPQPSDEEWQRLFNEALENGETWRCAGKSRVWHEKAEKQLHGENS